MSLMDLSTSNDNDHNQTFFDALDDFPFYDCSDSFSDQSDYSASSSSVVSTPDPIPPQETSFLAAATIRQRPSSSRGISDKESKDSGLNSSTISEIDSINGKRRSFRDKRYNIGRNLKENGEKPESTEEPVSSVQVTGGVSDQSNEYSTVSTVSEVPVHDSIDSTAEIDDSSFTLLVFVAGLVIKAIGFQLNLFLKFVTFPIWVFSNSYMFLIDPFFTMRRGREYFNGKMVKLWDFVCGFISPSVFDWLKENKSIWKVALRCFWGLLWASYVCFILCCILFWSILFGGLIMRYVVEEPIQTKEVLNFDFTKHRPVAFVPVISCVNANCDMDQIDSRRRIGYRTIPPGHKLQATVSLTLPESEYNRNLGIFQVRVDFLSVKGETLSSSSHPCMLQFKSEPIRLLWTFLKIAPLVTGYVSESQTLNVKFKGFTEGDVPTGCLKVTLEQRAEYRPGAGIPELYDASLVLESELPFFKRLLWYWKRTIFIWITMILFVAMLSLALLCCNRIIIPRPRSRARDGATQNTPPESSGNGRWYRVLPLGAVEHRQLHFLFAFFSPSFLQFCSILMYMSTQLI